MVCSCVVGNFASIKFGETAVIWYWQNLNLEFWMLSIIGMHALSLNWQFKFGDLRKICQSAKLKTSPKFPCYTACDITWWYCFNANIILNRPRDEELSVLEYSLIVLIMNIAALEGVSYMYVWWNLSIADTIRIIETGPNYNSCISWCLMSYMVNLIP